MNKKEASVKTRSGAALRWIVLLSVFILFGTGSAAAGPPPPATLLATPFRPTEGKPYDCAQLWQSVGFKP
ncbi:MAG: hypothetical protein ACJ74T_15395 [Pyrinomonadaceae bacterium]